MQEKVFISYPHNAITPYRSGQELLVLDTDLKSQTVYLSVPGHPTVFTRNSLLCLCHILCCPYSNLFLKYNPNQFLYLYSYLILGSKSSREDISQLESVRQEKENFSYKHCSVPTQCVFLYPTIWHSFPQHCCSREHDLDPLQCLSVKFSLSWQTLPSKSEPLQTLYDPDWVNTTIKSRFIYHCDTDKTVYSKHCRVFCNPLTAHYLQKS